MLTKRFFEISQSSVRDDPSNNCLDNKVSAKEKKRHKFYENKTRTPEIRCHKNCTKEIAQSRGKLPLKTAPPDSAFQDMVRRNYTVIRAISLSHYLERSPTSSKQSM